MRVFIPVFFNAPLGGLQSHVRAQAEALLRGGHTCTVMCKPGPFACVMQERGIEVLTTTFEDVRTAAAQACEAGAYDLVHAHPFRSREVGLSVAREQYVPLVVTFHGTYEDSLPTYVNEVTTIIAVSSAIRDFLVRTTSCPPERIVVIPNGVDADTFLPREPDWDELGARVPESGESLRLGDDRRVLLVSRLDEDKRFILDVVAETWREAARRLMFDVAWWVAGDGLLRAEMEAHADVLNRQAGRELVRFVGWQDEPTLANLCNACHLVVAPGRSALEAMACGRAVIAIGSKGYVGLIDGKTTLQGAYGNFGGFGQQHRTYESGTMCDEIDSVIYDDHALARLGRLSRALVDAFFRQSDLDRQLLRLYDVVRGLTPGGARGGPEYTADDRPALRFSAGDREAQLLKPWSYPKDDSRWQVHSTDGGGMLVRCDLGQGGMFYVRSNPDGFDCPPADREAWRLEQGREYVFMIPARFGGKAPGVTFWVIEYDNERRLGHTTLDLREGKNRMVVRTAPQTTSFSVAIRFSGSGEVALGPIEMFARAPVKRSSRCPRELRRSRELPAFHEYVGQNLVFVVGPPRSGTTWVLKLLDGHPDVVAANVDSLGARINDNRTLETNVFNDNRPFTDNQIRHKFFTLSHRHPGKVIAEKTPVHLLFVDRIFRVFPCAAVVLTERDGRDVVNSLIHVGRDRSAWWSGAPETVERAAILWRQYALAAIQCEMTYDPLKVRYEELLENPHGELRRLLTALGLSCDHIEAQVEACREGRNIPIPGVFREGARGGWAHAFTEEDVATFKRVAGVLLIRMGYEKDDAWGCPARSSGTQPAEDRIGARDGELRPEQTAGGASAEIRPEH